MIASLVFAVAIHAATIDEVFPLLHRVDPTAPFAFKQWPHKRYEFDNFGVTVMVWPERASLIIDEKIPLTAQLRALPENLNASKAARKLRVKRWDFTAGQCPAIPSMYESLHALPPEPVEIDTSGEIPIHGWMPNHQEMVFSHKHFETNLGWYQHALAFQDVWTQLDACSKRMRGRRVRAR